MEQPNTVTLNGVETTKEELEKKKQDQSIRIVETGPDQFKELHKLKG
jgi:hypothetical protein